MKKIALYILVSFIWNLQASHIVGGEIMYKYVSKTGSNIKYNVTLLVYIDCDNGSSAAITQDEKGSVNIFSYNPTNASYSNYSSAALQGTRTGPVIISDLNYNCIVNKPKICVSQYTYNFDITLPANTGGYVLSFERCCRNNTINNLIKPETTGATFWTKIPGALSIAVNSSPVFKSLPPNFLCANAPLNFDHSAIDADGDSLVYELYYPYNSPNNNGFAKTNPNNYTNVNWASGYSMYMQMDGSPTLSINRKTGKLTATPTRVGQFVVGIKVLEYRKGVLIGETKRDFQFNVNNCVFDVVSSFGVPYYNCTENDVMFQNRSQGSTRFFWNFGDDSTSADTSNFKSPTYTYKRDGYYTVKLVAASPFCADTSEFDIYVKRNFKINIGRDTLICGPFNMLLNANLSNKTYDWSTGAKTVFINVNKGGTYNVSVTDAPCVARDTITIINDLSTFTLGADSVICKDSFVSFNYSISNNYKTYSWNDGSNKNSVAIPKLSKYWVEVSNKNDCVYRDTIEFILYPPPKIMLHDTLFCRNTSVFLDGVNYNFITAKETNYLWSNGKLSPNITVSLPGLYTVKVRNKYCTVFDSAQLDYIVTGLDLGLDTFYCGPVKRLLVPNQNYINYLWHDYAETSTYFATTPGLKKVTITSKDGCIESDSVQLTQYPDADGGLGNDTTICLSTKLLLVAAPNMTSYTWNTGDNSRSIAIKDAGVYTVTVTNKNNCIVTDTIRIRENGDAMPTEMYMPDAFSPNGDGTNDVFPGNQYKDPGTDYLLRIYNRWGETIFESNKPANQWNGTFDNKEASQEVYMFYVKYMGCDENAHWVRGTFTLVR